MNADAIELSVGALASVAEREGLGSPHLTLQPEPMWLPREDLAAARAAVDGELAAAGLLDGRGRLDPDFRDWLPVLTTAAIEYYGWMTHEGAPFSVLAASRGLLGVVAVRRGDRITLAPADHTVLPAELAARLPEVSPGGGTRWAVRVSDFEEGRRHTHRDRSVAAIVAEISKVVERETTGGGELYVAERDPAGRRRSLRRPLHYVDTDWGRYVNYRVSVGDEDEFWVQPADAATVAATLESLRGQLTTAQRV